MVMKPEPLFEAIRSIAADDPREPWTIFLSPSGTPFRQSVAGQLATRDRLLLVCGRYEGFDERTLTLADQIISIGDYVMTGGELAAMVVVDTVVRLLPGVLGHENSTDEESFSDGLLEYPQYTRPPVFEDMAVPEVLLSGDHARIARWRREQAVARTARVRPDLLSSAQLSDEERALARNEMNRMDSSGEGAR